jgi:hypothetical protein
MTLSTQADLFGAGLLLYRRRLVNDRQPLALHRVHAQQSC